MTGIQIPAARAVAAVLVLAALLAGAACTTVPGGSAAMPGWVSLERTIGNRSIHLLTLYEDGRAMLEGVTPENERRTLTKSISPDEAIKVFQAIERVELWEHPPRYDVERTARGTDSVIVRTAPADAPWEILRAQRTGRMKRIDGLFFAPSELLDLKAQIERAVDLPEWLAALQRPSS